MTVSQAASQNQGSTSFDANGGPDLIWQNGATGHSTLWYMSGAQNNALRAWAYLTGPIAPWSIATTADLNGDTKPDLVLQNSVTGQITVWFMTGPDGNQLADWKYIQPSTMTDWRVAGAADFDLDGNTDLVLQNVSTGQATIWYLAGGQLSGRWAWLVPGAIPEWAIAGVADLDGDTHPDLVLQNDATRQATAWYMGGAQGTSFAHGSG